MIETMRGILDRMLTYLQRWKVVNALYHLSRSRDLQIWLPEHDLCAWISGSNMRTHAGPDTFFQKLKFRWWYFFFRVSNHDQLYQKIRNVVHQCERINWIERTKGDDKISDYIALSWRGEEVYPISHLIFGVYYARTIWTGVMVGLLVWFTIVQVEKIIPREPQRVQIEIIQPQIKP